VGACVYSAINSATVQKCTAGDTGWTLCVRSGAARLDARGNWWRLEGQPSGSLRTPLEKNYAFMSLMMYRASVFFAFMSLRLPPAVPASTAAARLPLRAGTGLYVAVWTGQLVRADRVHCSTSRPGIAHTCRSRRRTPAPCGCLEHPSHVSMPIL
jgi:hypothetical protein